ncbi:MAG: PKD domain-containing protein [Hydrotalea sp. AMD]|uniref:PKD domain-containing protein n=1 Tax=Hydrotalea TaxID=1004300 RepID=UPI001024C1F9|nr:MULTISPECIES: PKD domain-containing protein [Hydrotalea]RWZ87810.1 MAG: PKD domain-containing protein [Hydrotalea sp. AMD]
MKKILLIIIILMAVAHLARARHVAGGELFYKYLGPGTTPGTNSYQVTLRLFRDCASTGPLLQSENVIVGFYDGTTLVKSLGLPLTGGITTIQLNTANFPCLVGNVSVCYQIALYTNTIDLPINANGYTLSRMGCCRIDNISNLTNNNVGSDYVTFLPGTNTLPVGHNSSPEYKIKDTTLVCANKKFNLDFSAVDPDNDSLSYSFCDAYSAPNTGQNQAPSQFLTLTPVPYGGGYSGTMPLGNQVTIDPVTGIISGIAPPAGQYVVNVCIAEFRNGQQIGYHRKDFILKVQSCDIIEADLPSSIVNCKDYTVYFENQSTSSSILSYKWTVGDPANPSFSANTPTLQYTYPYSGRFVAHLTVTGPNDCVGTDSTIVMVYPGYKADFSVQGDCYLRPFQFTDKSTAKYGTVSKWQWNFGDPNSNAASSKQQNPSYTYSAPGTVNVTLISQSDKGCIDTAKQSVIIYSNPPLQLPFRDTLICSIDTLQLQSASIGAYSWVPNYNIINPNTPNPFVYPKITTTYQVTVNNNGCVSKDSIRVRVLDSISVKVVPDTTVCLNDTFRLYPVSEALGYEWFPATGIDNPKLKNPLFQPTTSTNYRLIAHLGKCRDTAYTRIITDPYPKANAGPDVGICFGGRTQLNATTNASAFEWTPNKNILYSNTLQPIVAPGNTTPYTLTVRYDTGCIKPVTDTILVTVYTPVKVNAGNDTAVVVNQPLQLMATSNYDSDSTGIIVQYAWIPTSYLSNPNIPNPIATFNGITDSIQYTVMATTSARCTGADKLWVRVFRTGPDIFIPTAFTPNHDNKNDILKPIPVGITDLRYFSIYNRWGQLIFTTNQIGEGWDGTYNGSMQPAGTYVYTAEGIDFTGKKIYKKGTVVLIR